MFKRRAVEKQQRKRLIDACIRKAKDGYVLSDEELEIAQTAIGRLEINDAEAADKAVDKAISDWNA